MAETERIILGSGNVHMKLFDGNLPSVDEICTDENQISYIQGGATIEYKPSYYTAKDDTRKIQKTVITDEEATMKSGLMTFCGNTLEKICDTARVSYAEKTSAKKKRRIVKVGGGNNQGRKKYVICFHHEDPVDGDIWVMIVGNNQAGFSLAFANDKETVVDAEFTALPQDKEGTLIHYEEEVLEDTQSLSDTTEQKPVADK
jgi:hypothetical protein